MASFNSVGAYPANPPALQNDSKPSAHSVTQLAAKTFPGIGAKFELSIGGFTFGEQDCILADEVVFTSRTEGSTFRKFSIFCETDGTAKLAVSCGKVGLQYLLDCGVSFDKRVGEEQYISKPETRHLLFQIIAKHNEIPAIRFATVRILVEKGSWR